jgi:septum formation protein
MGLWLGTSPLILASQSSARKILLANAGLEFEAATADIDERGIQATSKLSNPREIGLLLAREKAKAVSANRPGSYVIGADQTLALGDRLFNKPAGRAQALAQLRDLAGHIHELNSAVAVAHDGEIVFEDVSVARMTVRKMTEAGLSAYLDAAGDAVTTSVGAYQLEGLGIHLFERIEGDHFTILGLPLLPLLAFLRSEQLIAV